MKIQLRKKNDPEWQPPYFPTFKRIPVVGESIHTYDGSSYIVNAVAWYPWGEDDDRTPFVMIIMENPYE